jgi:preprotein translocase subunit SecG
MSTWSIIFIALCIAVSIGINRYEKRSNSDENDDEENRGNDKTIL